MLLVHAAQIAHRVGEEIAIKGVQRFGVVGQGPRQAGRACDAKVELLIRGVIVGPACGRSRIAHIFVELVQLLACCGQRGVMGQRAFEKHASVDKAVHLGRIGSVRTHRVDKGGGCLIRHKCAPRSTASSARLFNARRAVIALTPIAWATSTSGGTCSPAPSSPS